MILKTVPSEHSLSDSSWSVHNFELAESQSELSRDGLKAIHSFSTDSLREWRKLDTVSLLGSLPTLTGPNHSEGLPATNLPGFGGIRVDRFHGFQQLHVTTADIKVGVA